MRITFPRRVKLDPNYVAYRNSKGVWVDAYGNEARVDQLSDTHLKNVGKTLLVRAWRILQNNRSFYSSCPGPDGEAAQDAFESEYQFWCEVDDFEALEILVETLPFWEHFRREWIKRHYERKAQECPVRIVRGLLQSPDGTS